MIIRRDETQTTWTIAELLQWTEAFFQRLGLSSPRLDAELLLAEALGRTRVELYTNFGMLVQTEERARFRALVERRSRKEPVAYILGRREFYSLSFEVTPAVLVPRPETEHLVEVALKELAGDAASVLDVGTGSGCIAVAIAVNNASARVDAIDLSAAALEVARRNASVHGVADRVRFLEGDLLAALPAGAGPYRVILSNPPYVSAAEYERLMDDVRLHEPAEALIDSKSPGRDGLGFYRALAASSGAFLAPGGLLAVEVGAGQAAGVRSIFEAGGWRVKDVVRDLGGIERVVRATR